MNAYTIRYGHSETDIPGQFKIHAATDQDAINEVNAFVKSGYRNGTWATMAITDGYYAAHNEHGKAVCTRISQT